MKRDYLFLRYLRPTIANLNKDELNQIDFFISISEKDSEKEFEEVQIKVLNTLGENRFGECVLNTSFSTLKESLTEMEKRELKDFFLGDIFFFEKEDEIPDTRTFYLSKLLEFGYFKSEPVKVLNVDGVEFEVYKVTPKFHELLLDLKFTSVVKFEEIKQGFYSFGDDVFDAQFKAVAEFNKQKGK